MATAAFLSATATAPSVSADGVLKWINEIAASRTFHSRKPNLGVAQISKILQNKKARDIVYHLVANTKSRNRQIEVIGNLFLQKKLSAEEVSHWRDRLPELQLPDLAQGEGAATSLEPQAARHLIKKQAALREVEQLADQLMKLKVELISLARTAGDLTEKLPALSAGNAVRKIYLDQINSKASEWKRTTNELRRRLVSAGARSSRFAAGSSLRSDNDNDRVGLAAGQVNRIVAQIGEAMLEDDLAMLKKGGMKALMPGDTGDLVEKLAGDFTVGEIGSALLLMLNKAVVELENKVDGVDVSSEIKDLMFDYDPATGELRDTSPLVTQPASAVMAALTLERETALLKVSAEAAEARMDANSLQQRFDAQTTAVEQELKRWVHKDAATLAKLKRYVQLACAVAGYEEAEKAVLSGCQAVEAEVRTLESRNRHASLARSKLSSFQKNLEDQLVVIRRLLEFAAGMRHGHEAVMASIGDTLETGLLPQASTQLVQGDDVKQARLDELRDFGSKNISAMHWAFNSSAIKRHLATVGEVFAHLGLKAAKSEFGTRLLYLGPTAFVSSMRDDIILYRCRSALAERLEDVLAQAKPWRYDEKRVKSVVEEHDTVASQNWERWSGELIQASRDCQAAIDEGIPAYRRLISDWRSQPGQFAADWLQLDGLPYRDYLRTVTFHVDSIRQRQEMAV